MLGRSVGNECCRGVLEKSFVERSFVEKCWRKVLERRVVQAKCWRKSVLVGVKNQHLCVCQYQPRALFLLHCWRDIGCDIAAAATSVAFKSVFGFVGCSPLHVANNDAALKSPCCCLLHSPPLPPTGNPAKTRISISRCISNSRCTRSF